MVGTQVTGKRLGIVGLGRVGQVTARRARGFDMTIHYHDVQRLPAAQEQGAIYHPTPEDLMPHCDFLAFHCVVDAADPEDAQRRADRLAARRARSWSTPAGAPSSTTTRSSRR